MNKKKNSVYICLIFSIIILTSFSLANISYAADKSDSITLSQNDIIESSKSLYSYIKINEKLPESIKVSNKNYSTEQFLFSMSNTVICKKDNIKCYITIKSNFKKATNPIGSSINGKFYLKDMCNYSKNIIEFMNKNNRAPNFLKTKFGKMQYETIIFIFSKFLANTHNGELANNVIISVSKESPINNKGYNLELFNTFKNGDSLQKYLISTKNAPANSEYIKELANQITKNHYTSLSKAEAIFDWVKNNIKYSRYGNTKYGGEQTLKQKRGNCVDNAHALVSLLRASNIPVRYVNGRCEFTKGDLAKITVAHVWVQVLVGGRWMVADGIYKGNRLGYVTNWKSNSYKLYGIYSSI